MFVLTSTERLLFLTGCVVLFCFISLITICCVCPKCWINRKIRKPKKAGKDTEMTSLRSPKCTVELTPAYESSLSLKGLASNNSFSSGCSDTDSVAGIPLPLLSDMEIPALEVKDCSSPHRGSLSVVLHYKNVPCHDDKVFSQLRVDLKEAAELSGRPYGGLCNPYFVVSIYDSKSFHKKKRRKPIFEFHSTVLKKSQDPVYNESFFFPIKSNLLKRSVLKFEAWDSDKLANDTILGEIILNLKDVAPFLLKDSSKELDLSLKLEDSKLSYGEILLGLCYLPTAERMTIAVLKANISKNSHEQNTNGDYYVQALAIYGGRIFERRKTSKRFSSQHPVFNEMLMFDVPFAKLDQIIILLAVYSTEEQIHQNTARPFQNNKCLGKVVIGKTSVKNTLNHWNAMRNSPRRQVLQWHELK